jgi:aspartyl-tRNA(Asn)/glutamyl-tRNA(Gln) amidotransferase subunit A
VVLVPGSGGIGTGAGDVGTAGRVVGAIAGPSADDPSSRGARIGDTTTLDGAESRSIGLVENTLALADEAVAERTRDAVAAIEEATPHTVDPVTLEFGDVDFAFSVVIGAEFAWLRRQGFALRGQGTQYNPELRHALEGHVRRDPYFLIV